MGNVVHLVPRSRQKEHGHCPDCGVCIPTDFNILVRKGDMDAAKSVHGISFSCPGCGKAMVTERPRTHA